MENAYIIYLWTFNGETERKVAETAIADFDSLEAAVARAMGQYDRKTTSAPMTLRDFLRSGAEMLSDGSAPPAGATS